MAEVNDWPTRWELTAPESHVLYYRGGEVTGEAFRLAVTELVSKKVLRVEAIAGGLL